MKRTLTLIAGAGAAVAVALSCAQAVPSAPTDGVAMGSTVVVAAASDLAPLLARLGPELRQQAGLTITASIGSSGNLYAQILNGAPFDVFLSADTDYPRRLEAAGAVRPGSFRVYAVGRLALWSSRGLPEDLEREGLAALLSPSVRRIAMANPEHAPYGRAAAAALERENLAGRLRNKLVLGENVAQAAQFLESGAADAGFISESLARSSSLQAKGTAWPVPASLYPRLEQAAVVTKQAKNPEAALKLLDYLSGPEGRRLLAEAGFDLP